MNLMAELLDLLCVLYLLIFILSIEFLRTKASYQLDLL